MMNNPNTSTQADNELQKQILEQIPTPVIAMDVELRVIYMNAAGRLLLGKSPEQIKGQKCFDLFHSRHCNTVDCCMVKAIQTGKPCCARNEVTLDSKTLPIEYYAVPLKNKEGAVVGGLEYVLDITDRILYEQKLQEQSRTILEISTPAIKLWDGVVVLPVVGVIDTLRAQHMMDTMLQKIMETSSKVIILDIQGVAAVDTAVANHLIKITKATRLMGCQCILSGISPAVAQAIVQLGIEMGDIKTNSTLRDALADAFAILNLEVKDIKSPGRCKP